MENSKIIRIEVPIGNAQHFIYIYICYVFFVCLFEQQVNKMKKTNAFNETRPIFRQKEWKVFMYFCFKLNFIDAAAASPSVDVGLIEFSIFTSNTKPNKNIQDYFEIKLDKNHWWYFLCVCVIIIKCLPIQHYYSVWIGADKSQTSILYRRPNWFFMMLHFEQQKI